MGRWLYSFQAINPKDPSKKWEVGIEEWLYRLHQTKGNKKALSRIILVHEVLECETIRIYGGWSRLNKEDCFVYEGLPKHDYHSGTIETPPPPKMAFLVFVLPCGTIDDWAWRPLAGNESKKPDGIEGKILWEHEAI